MIRPQIWMDCETGGLDVNVHSPLQFAFLAVRENTIFDSLEMHLRIDPLVVDQQALGVTKIDLTKEGIKSFEEAKKIYMAFMNKNFYSKIVNGKWSYEKPSKENMPLFCGHNIFFDRPWLKKVVGDFDYCYYHSICTMVLSEAIRDSGKFPDIKDLKLETLCSYLNIPKPEGQFHNAMTDIRQTFLLYQKLKEFIK